MINLLSHTASKVQKKLGGASAKSRQKCKLTLLVRRILVEGTERGHVSVELSRGLKAAATAPMPVKDGLVLVAGAPELSIISTIERDEYNERREKIFKLSVKLVSTDQNGKKIDGDSKVLGAIEIDVADFIGNGDPLNVQQARTWSVPCRKGDKHITIETVCSARPVPTHKVVEHSDDSNFSDMSSHGASDDEDTMPSLQQVFTGSDRLQSALKFQSDSDYQSESDTTPKKSAISPPMLGIGVKLTKSDKFRGTEAENHMIAGGVSESPLNPVSLTVSKLLARKDDAASRETAVPMLSADLAAAKRRVPLAGKHLASTHTKADCKAGKVVDGGGECGIAISHPPGSAEGRHVSVQMQDRRLSGDDLVASAGEGNRSHGSRCSGGDDITPSAEVNTYVVAKDQDGKAERTCGRCGGLDQHVLELQTKLDNTLEQASQRLCLLDQRETRIRELEVSVAEAGAELERRNAKLHEKEQDNVHWQEKFGIADREMALMESEMKEIEGKNQRLEKDVHQLQKQCKNLKQDLDKERRRADQDADQREREYELALERERTRSDSLLDKLSDLKDQVSGLTQQLQASKEEVQDVSDERDRLLRESSELRAAESESKKQQRKIALELEDVKQSCAKAVQTATGHEETCRLLSEKLRECERQLEKSQAGQRVAEDQITGMEAHLQAAHSRSRALEERLNAQEAQACKEQMELKKQLEETEGLLLSERNMSEVRGQEQQQGRSELEEHNRVLTDRIGRLVADQKEAGESLKKMESQREELQEKLEGLQAEVKRAGLAQEACERDKAQITEQARQMAQDLQLCTSQRDETARERAQQSEKLNQVESSLTSKLQELLETQEALQKEKELSSQNEHAHQTERNSLRAQIDKLQLFVSDASRKLAETDEKCKHLESQLEAAAQETKIAQAQVSTAQSELSSARMEMEAERKMKEESEAVCTTAKDDLTKTMAHAKDTIGQLKQMCARLETSLQTKQDALHDAQKEVDTLQKQKDDLLDRLTTTLDNFKKKEEEWGREQEEWGHERKDLVREREEWKRNAAELQQARQIEREEAEELKRMREEKKQRIQQEVQDAKASARRGGVEGTAACAFCAVLQGQEDMLDKGLSVECALLDIVQQRFPLLGELEREHNQAKKEEWFQKMQQLEAERVRGLSDMPKLTTSASEASEQPSPSGPSCAAHEGSSAIPSTPLDPASQADQMPPSEQQTLAIQTHEMDGEGEVYYKSRIIELERELQQVKSDAELEATVAKASQRQLVATSDKVCRLEAQVQQMQADVNSKDDPEIIQQLIQARIGHAEAEGLALEMHRQNAELRQVIRKLKQKLTSMEVRLYKVEEEDEVFATQPNAPSKDDHSSTFGARVRNALRKTLFGANSSGAGGETKKTTEGDVSEIRERDAKIKQLSERLQSLESLYNQLLEQHNDQS